MSSEILRVFMRFLARYFVCLVFMFFSVCWVEIALLGILSIPIACETCDREYHLCPSSFSANGAERFYTEIRSQCSETKATGVKPILGASSARSVESAQTAVELCRSRRRKLKCLCQDNDLFREVKDVRLAWSMWNRVCA